MSDSSSSSLDVSLAQRIDSVCNQFELAWQEGDHPQIEDFLTDFHEKDRHWLLLELIQLDAYYRSQAGEEPKAEEYQNRFPELESDCLEASLSREFDPAMRTVGVDSTIPPGTKVGYLGDYELLEEIARGGMGVVYKARQTSLSRIVAVKMILTGQFASEQEAKRFQTEAEAAANLKHRHIVAVYEVGEYEGQSYFSMDYIEGKNLAEFVREHPLPPRTAARYVHQIAEAIHFAHQQGTLHRDLKPSNVLIDANDEVKITDFGLATQVEADSGLTQTGQILGTPSYMPPEQAQGKRLLIGPASDVYSLGAILYELLTGRPPFKADNTLETLRQVIETEPISPRLLNPAVPKDLETICLKCLEKEPHKRILTGELLAEELERFLNGEPILSRPISRVERVWRACKRNPAVASLIATVLLVLVVGVVTTTTFAVLAKQEANKNSRLTAIEKASRKKAEQAEKIASKQRDLASDNAERAERLLYGSQIRLAQLNWEQGNAEAANHYLTQCRRNLRGWEYHYLRSAFSSGFSTYRGHEKAVRCVAFSSDGKFVASGSDDKTIKIWGLHLGRATHTFRGHTDLIRDVTFNPNGTLLVSCSDDSTIKIWSIETGMEITSLSGHRGRIFNVDCSPDGKRLVSCADDGTLKIWDIERGKEERTLKGHAGRVYCVRFSRDGKKLASGSRDQTIKIWNAENGNIILTLRGLRTAVTGLAFSPGGKNIVACGGNPNQSGRINVWDIRAGRVVKKLSGHINQPRRVVYSPDGNYIASCSYDTTLILWDAHTGEEIRNFRGHFSHVFDLAFSPDSKRIVSGSNDLSIKLWDIEIDQGSNILSSDTIRCLDISPDGTHIVSGSLNQSLKLWNAKTGKEIRTLNGHTARVHCVTFSADGKQIVSGGYDQVLKVWDTETGEGISTFRGHKVPVIGLDFNPVKKEIVSIDQEGIVKVWNFETGQEVLTFQDQGPLRQNIGIGYSPDGQKIAFGSHENILKICDARTGELIGTFSGHHSSIYSVAFSPDGTRILTGSEDKTLKLWDTQTGKGTHTLEGHHDSVYCVAFSPDGKRIVSSNDDNTVKVWDSVSGNELLTLKGHTWYVRCVAFSPDGRRIVSGSYDRTLRIWDAGPEFKLLGKNQ